MKKHVLDILKERGFLAQITFEEDLYKRLAQEEMTIYVGVDPTADSLHVGHIIPVMAMAHLQQAGHRPLILCGGATAMIGDPSGKTDMRKMMSRETIADNISHIKSQLEKFLDFGEGKAKIVNNADWLMDLNYIDFLRDIGAHFSVNRMLAAEAYKQRLERGLTFLEFNYMLMQSYDFLHLFKTEGCRLQIGGDDQWSNILAGADLIRRKEQEEAFALTCNLIMTHDGQKMGKTVAGALWLDGEKVSPYEFYQYWRNVADQDVEKFLGILTFLPMEEVRRLGALQGAEINQAKEVLAFEITKLIHGTLAASEAQEASRALFAGGANMENIPTFALSQAQLEEDNRMVNLLMLSGLCKSKGEARKMIQAGAISANDEKITDVDYVVSPEALQGEGMLLRRGKKSYCKVVLA
ncbi:MAG: tyrosine--tRNA ligase [Clostridiales bacterium]|nr:tyrosine--tRNA ligase [Clostridiales bacterium]